MLTVGGTARTWCRSEEDRVREKAVLLSSPPSSHLRRLGAPGRLIVSARTSTRLLEDELECRRDF